jgi:diadenosine tetraphosphate (Ap4A) HIT family hydrolase
MAPFEKIIKTAHIEVPDMWGTFNMKAGVTASNAGYMLAITKSQTPRFEALTGQEQKAFWNFMFGQTKEALNNPDYFPKEDFGYDVQPANGFVLAMHDGWVAGQTVPHVHGHIMGIAGNADFDVLDRVLLDHRMFNNGQIRTPLAAKILPVDADFADSLTETCRSLKSQFAKSAQPDDIGFTVYSTKPVTVNEPIDMRVEMWSKEHPTLTGISNHMRYWTGMVQAPTWGGAPGIKWGPFEKAAP